MTRVPRCFRFLLAAGLLLGLSAAPAAAADFTFTHRASLEPAAHAIEVAGWDLELMPNPEGDFVDSDGDGLAEAWCWNRAASLGDPRMSETGGGFYDGYVNLAYYVCNPALKALGGWKPTTYLGRWRLGYAAFVIGHEAAHAAGAGHDERDCKSADGIAAANIRRILARLGVRPRERRAIERVLRGESLGYYPKRTNACWQPL